MILKKKFFVIALISVLFIALAGCGGNSEKSGGAAVKKSDTGNVQAKVETPEGSVSVDLGKGGENLPLPEAYPEDTVPLTEDANIINVRDARKSAMGICYVTGLDMDATTKFYENVLSDADDFCSSKVDKGLMFTGKKNDMIITIFIQKGIFDSISEYKGKVSVNIDIGMPKVEREAKEIDSDSKLKWPASDLPGVPVLEGSIEMVAVEETVLLDIKVDGMDTVLDYVKKLEKAGFASDDYPGKDADYVQFIAFGEKGYVNFNYDDSEKLVNIEYGEES